MMLALLIATLLGLGSACLPGYTTVYDGICLKNYGAFDENAEGYYKAKKLCLDDGTNLLEINSARENSQFLNYQKWNPGSSDFVLGMECINGDLMWATGQRFGWTNFNYDSVPSCDPARNFMTWHVKGGRWNEFYNGYHVTAVCMDTPPYHGPCRNFDEIPGQDGSCYKLLPSAKSWEEAQDICAYDMGTLAVIQNKAQNDAIRRAAISKGFTDGIHIGLISENGGQSFKWIDGSNITYKNFEQGYPKKGAGNCGFMQTYTTAGTWENGDCSKQLPFVCTRKADVIPLGAYTCHGNPAPGDQIYSPMFPVHTEIPCVYELVVDQGSKVEFELFFLETNDCCGGSLKIYEGNTLIASLSGSTPNTRKYTTQSSNTMKLVWNAEEDVNVRGFHGTFRAH